MSAQSTNPPTWRCRLHALTPVFGLLVLASIPLCALQYLQDDGFAALVEEEAPATVGASAFAFDGPAATRNTAEERRRETQAALARLEGDRSEGELQLDQWQPTQFFGGPQSFGGFPFFGPGFTRGNSFFPVFPIGIFFAGFGSPTPFQPAFGVLSIAGFSQSHRSFNPTLLIFNSPRAYRASPIR